MPCEQCKKSNQVQRETLATCTFCHKDYCVNKHANLRYTKTNGGPLVEWICKDCRCV